MASWNAVLETYTRSRRPRAELPPGVFLSEDEHTLAIFDGYEKARFHFLVMPREPFKLSSGGDVPSQSLSSLSALLKSPHALEVLNALKKSADEVKVMIQDEMRKTEGWTWPVQTGFHASESMKHVHLHVISSDLLSPKLKNKKHYNSFHPKLGFFLHLDDVLEQVKTKTVDKRSPASFESILKEPLQSIYTGEEFSTIPKLKTHLEAEFAKAGRKAKKLLKEEADKAAKRKGDELDAPAQEQKKRKELSEPK